MAGTEVRVKQQEILHQLIAELEGLDRSLDTCGGMFDLADELIATHKAALESLQGSTEKAMALNDIGKKRQEVIQQLILDLQYLNHRLSEGDSCDLDTELENLYCLAQEGLAAALKNRSTKPTIMYRCLPDLIIYHIEQEGGRISVWEGSYGKLSSYDEFDSMEELHEALFRKTPEEASKATTEYMERSIAKFRKVCGD